MRYPMTYDKHLTRLSHAYDAPFRLLIDGAWVTLQPCRYYAVQVSNRSGRGGRGRFKRTVVEVRA